MKRPAPALTGGLRSWAPILVLLLTLSFTGIATLFVVRTLELRDRARYVQEVDRTLEDIESRMAAYITILEATSGLFATRPDVDLPTFRTFVQHLDITRRYPGVQGVGWSIRVPPGEEAAVEETLRRIDPHARLWPDPRGGERHAILYLEPLDWRNRRALGFNMYQETVRQEAMRRARDEARPIMSGKVALVQEGDDGGQPGFLIYAPVYRTGAPTGTLEERVAALEGFVYCPFRTGDLLAGIFGRRRPPVGFAIYDGPADVSSLLFDARDMGVVPDGPRFEHAVTLRIAGRDWTLQFWSMPELERALERPWAPVVALAGVALSLLLFFLFRSQVRARLAAERLAGELRSSEETLREVNRAKDQFLAMLGHELRTPLAAMGHALEVIWLRDRDDERLARAREVVERQLRIQSRLVEDLLDVSRVNSGKITLKRETVELNQLARRSLQALEGEAHAHGHTLKLHPASGPVRVYGDPVRLEQVIWNLVSNAIKYTPEGGRIEVTVGQDDGRAMLAVRDNGAGIAPEMLHRVFELFTQLDESLDRARGGLGLGLSLVRRLVQLHGGEVTGHSEGLGHGSEFVVRLPLHGDTVTGTRSRESTAGDGQEPQVEPIPSDRPRILVVEDNEDIREALTFLLDELGADVALAEDGAEGVKKALELLPDLVLVDIGLPELDGYQVVQRVRETDEGRRLRMVALTGYGQPSDRRRAREAGFDDHLVKPVSVEELVKLLDTLRAERGKAGLPAQPVDGGQ